MWTIKPILPVLIAGAMAASLAGQSDSVKLRADQWMPFNGTPGGDKPGYVVELAQLIFSARQVKVDYQIQPWEDTLKAVRAGEVDGAIGTNTTEAAGLITGTEPIGLPKVGLFVVKESTWKYQNLQSLNGTKFGAIAGYSYWDSLDNYIKSHADKNVIFFKGESPLVEAIEHLSRREIDVLPETLAVFVWGLKKEGRSFSDYRLAYLHEGQPIFIAFTKNEKGLRFSQMLEDGIRELRANGQLAKLLANYGIEDWKE